MKKTFRVINGGLPNDTPIKRDPVTINNLGELTRISFSRGHPSYRTLNVFLNPTLESFDSAWIQGDKYFLVFENTDGNTIYASFKGKNNIVVETFNLLRESGNLKLTMALDTTHKFEDQVPEAFFTGVTSWKQLNTAPLITINALKQYFKTRLTKGLLQLKFGITKMPENSSHDPNKHEWRDPTPM